MNNRNPIGFWWNLGLSKPHQYKKCICDSTRKEHCTHCCKNESLCIRINELQEMFILGRITKEQLLYGAGLVDESQSIQGRRSPNANTQRKRKSSR